MHRLLVLNREHNSLTSTYLFILATLLLSFNFIRLGGLAVSDWFYISALGCAIIETLTIQKKHFNCWYKNPLIPASYLIGLGAIFSTINSQAFGIALLEIIQQLFVLTVFISLIWILVRRGKTRSIIFAFILSGVYTASIGLIDYLTGSQYGPILSGTSGVEFWGRYAGTLGHPNKFGFFLVITALMSIGFFADYLKNKRRSIIGIIIWGGITFIQLFGIYLSNSITAYIGFLTGAFMFVVKYIFVNKDIKRYTVRSILLVPISSIFLALVLLPGINKTRTIDFIQNAINRVVTTTSLSRMEGYKLSWQEIERNPFIGAGYDQLSTAGMDPEELLLGYSVHNALLQIWYAGGMFAFLGWLAIYVYISVTAIKFLIFRREYSPILIGLLAVMFSVLIMDQFQDAIYQREKWLAIGLFLSLLWKNNGEIIYQTNDQ